MLLHAAASWQGGAPRAVALAYRAGLSGILPPRCWVPFAAEPVDAAKLDVAWTELAALSAPARRAVVEAVVRVITAERRIAAAGFDLLRLAMLRLDVPVAALPLNAKLEEAAMPNARRQGGG
ncbi:MAG: hypothetical protein U1F11_11165 [Steroidobacteraceae bacterium]